MLKRKDTSPRPLALVPPKTNEPWPPIPSVLRGDECCDECGVGNLNWTLRRSYVALLLSRLCAGMPSDSPFCDVLARVRDCNALSELLACDSLDEEGREYSDFDLSAILLRGDMEDPLDEPLMLCYGSGADDTAKYKCTRAIEKRVKIQYKYALGPLRDKVQRADGVELGRLAAIAADEQDFVSYKLIMKVMAKTSPTTTDFNLWSAIEAVGHMRFSGDDDYNTMDRWLSPLSLLVINSSEHRFLARAWGGHTRKTFERLLWHQLHFFHIESGRVLEVWNLLSLYPEWAVPALVDIWNDQESGLLHHKTLVGSGLCEDEDEEDHLHPLSQWRESMRRLFRTTILVLCQGIGPSDGWWKRVGWIMQALAQCCPYDNPGLAIVKFAEHDRLVDWESLTWDVLKPKLQAWCMGMILWRVQLQRQRQFCLLDWMESANVYAPTNGRAPKRLCTEFEAFNTFA